MRRTRNYARFLKIYFEIRFKEMVSGKMHRSSPAGLELEQPSWH